MEKALVYNFGEGLTVNADVYEHEYYPQNRYANLLSLKVRQRIEGL